MGTIKQLRWWAYKILPLAYDDSLSYYEVLAKATQKLNEVIDTTNKLPEAISQEVASQLSGSDTDIYNNLFGGIINAIATKESDEVGYTPNEKQGGEVIWLGDTLYEVVVPMAIGTNYVVGSNIIPVDVDGMLREIKNYICTHNEYFHVRATQAHNTQTYLYWKDKLYRVDADIHVNDILAERSTVDGTSVGQLTLVNTMDEITAHYIEMHEADNNLQTQIDGNDGDIEELRKSIATVTATAGAPAFASSTGYMTDTTRVYVLTTDGHIYYYNGEKFIDSGMVYGEINELADARKSNSTFGDFTYDDLGTAIRHQTELSDQQYQVPFINSDISFNNILFNRNYFIDNEYVDTRGAIRTNTTYFARTPYVPLSGTTHIYSHGTGLTAFYGASKEFLSTLPNVDDVDVPENAVFMICSVPKENAHSNSFYMVRNIKNYDRNQNFKYVLSRYGKITIRTPFEVSGTTISFTNHIVFMNKLNWRSLVYNPTTAPSFNIGTSQALILSYHFDTTTNPYVVTDNPFSVVSIYDTVFSDSPIVAYNIDGTVVPNFDSSYNWQEESQPFYHDGFQKFTVAVNNHFLPTGTENETLDGEAMTDINCALYMPKGYTNHGKPSKLLMVCHGAGRGLFQDDDDKSWNTLPSYQAMIKTFADAGWFCFDCTGYANTDDGINFNGAPRGVEAWRKAYNYIINTYNVEHQFCIYGFSMGGLTALEIGRTMFPNVQAIALGSPVLNLKYWIENNPAALERCKVAYGFETFDPSYIIGCDPCAGIITIGDKEYCTDKYPPLRIWYGSTEIGQLVEASSSERFTKAVNNSNGFCSRRIVDGAGHGISYGEDPAITNEYVYFLNRYTHRFV